MYPLIGASSLSSNLPSTRQLFGDEEQNMSQIIEHCAGIDVGKRFLRCWVWNGEAAAAPSRETLRFDTTVSALTRLRDWLKRDRKSVV